MNKNSEKINKKLEALSSINLKPRLGFKEELESVLLSEVQKRSRGNKFNLFRMFRIKKSIFAKTLGSLALTLFLTTSAVLAFNEEARHNVEDFFVPKGSLIVETKNINASVKLGGEYKGEAPLKLSRIETGEHKLEISLEGYKPLQKTIEIDKEKTTYVYLEINEEGEPVFATKGNEYTFKLEKDDGETNYLSYEDFDYTGWSTYYSDYKDATGNYFKVMYPSSWSVSETQSSSEAKTSTWFKDNLNKREFILIKEGSYHYESIPEATTTIKIRDRNKGITVIGYSKEKNEYSGIDWYNVQSCYNSHIITQVCQTLFSVSGQIGVEKEYLDVYKQMVASYEWVGKGVENWRTYQNSRFGFSVEYPSVLLPPLDQPPTNNDGRTFQDENGEVKVLVYGRHNSLNQTLEEIFTQNVTDSVNEVIYSDFGDDFYVASGLVDGKIFYEKTYLKGDRLATLRFEYDTSMEEVMNVIVDIMVESFELKNVEEGKQISGSVEENLYSNTAYEIDYSFWYRDGYSVLLDDEKQFENVQSRRLLLCSDVFCGGEWASIIFLKDSNLSRENAIKFAQGLPEPFYKTEIKYLGKETDLFGKEYHSYVSSVSSEGGIQDSLIRLYEVNDSGTMIIIDGIPSEAYGNIVESFKWDNSSTKTKQNYLFESCPGSIVYSKDFVENQSVGLEYGSSEEPQEKVTLMIGNKRYVVMARCVKPYTKKGYQEYVKNYFSEFGIADLQNFEAGKEEVSEVLNQNEVYRLGDKSYTRIGVETEGEEKTYIFTDGEYIYEVNTFGPPYPCSPYSLVQEVCDSDLSFKLSFLPLTR